MELRAGEGFVRSTHRLTNVGYEPVPFMWGIHPGIAVRPGARIQVPGTTGTFHEGHPDLALEPGTQFAWPHLPAASGSIDLSVAQPPEPPSWQLAFVDGLRAGWLAVTDPVSRSGFAMSFDPAVFPVAWLWAVYGGWRGLYTVALEAWTAHPPRLDEVIAAGRARTLEPGESLETEVRFIAFEGIGSVAEVTPDGAVRGDG
jgi:galactose mutarotase-like enzyme